MARCEQFEVWVQRGAPAQWEMAAAFPHLEIANTVAHNYMGRRVRLLHVIYENDAVVETQTMMELGSTRAEEHVAVEEPLPPREEPKRSAFGGLFGRRKA
jgi:hypothetical protein